MAIAGSGSRRRFKSKSHAKSKQNQLEKTAPTLKERLAEKKKRDRLRKEIISFTTFAVFFSALIGFLVGLTIDPKAGIGTGVGVLYTSLSFRYPRYALWAFLIYLPFGGTITYAIGNNPLLQLAKDGFYIPALIGVIQYCRRERLPIIVCKPLMVPLSALLMVCFVTLLLVNGSQQLSSDGSEQPILLGILGLKVLIGYVPLIVCAYYLIRNKQDLFFLTRLTSILILVCCGLAFVQYFFLKNGICVGTQFEQGSDLFKASLEARCFVGGSLLYSPQHNQIRLPGTFVAPWQWGWFLISAGFLSFACAFNDPKARWRTIGLIAMGSVFVMSVLSGQRVALALVPVAVVLLLLLTGQIANLKRFIPIAVVLSILLSFAAARNPELMQERFDSFQSRWEASPPQDFIIDQFTWVAKEQNGIFGNGLGRATNAARALGTTKLIETYYPKVLYEIGPLGLLCFLALVTTLTFQTFKAYRSVRDRTLRSYGASFWVYVLFISYNTYYYPLDVDPVAVYYWFFAGVVLKLPELDRHEDEDVDENKSQRKGKKRRRLKRTGSFA
ncbi:MAG: hormogonium polysaccharide biosynthesis protein HpsL [Elainellaceae cyanobacterium]